MTWDTKNLPAHKLYVDHPRVQGKKSVQVQALLLGEIHNQADIIGP